MDNKITIEVCTTSPACIYEAYKAQAHRVEICSNLLEGGTTPPLSWVEYALSLKILEVYVLVRPRAGDFVYSELEYNTMIRDIELCGQIGCNGVVFGILDKDNKVDVERNKRLVQIANKYNMKTTFHRAIDRINNPETCIDTIVELGFDRILSSGGELTATNGLQTLKSMIERANGEIAIMPGAGVSSGNIERLVKELNTTEFHGSFSKYIDNKEQAEKSDGELFEKDNERKQADEKEIKKVIQLANMTFEEKRK